MSLYTCEKRVLRVGVCRPFSMNTSFPLECAPTKEWIDRSVAATSVLEREFEAEQRILALDDAIDTCAEDTSCLQAHAADSDARRDADGPLVV